MFIGEMFISSSFSLFLICFLFNFQVTESMTIITTNVRGKCWGNLIFNELRRLLFSPAVSLLLYLFVRFPLKCSYCSFIYQSNRYRCCAITSADFESEEDFFSFVAYSFGKYFRRSTIKLTETRMTSWTRFHAPQKKRRRRTVVSFPCPNYIYFHSIYFNSFEECFVFVLKHTWCENHFQQPFITELLLNVR